MLKFYHQIDETNEILKEISVHGTMPKQESISIVDLRNIAVEDTAATAAEAAKEAAEAAAEAAAIEVKVKNMKVDEMEKAMKMAETAAKAATVKAAKAIWAADSAMASGNIGLDPKAIEALTVAATAKENAMEYAARANAAAVNVMAVAGVQYKGEAKGETITVTLVANKNRENRENKEYREIPKPVLTQVQLGREPSVPENNIVLVDSPKFVSRICLRLIFDGADVYLKAGGYGKLQITDPKTKKPVSKDGLQLLNNIYNGFTTNMLVLVRDNKELVIDGNGNAYSVVEPTLDFGKDDQNVSKLIIKNSYKNVIDQEGLGYKLQKGDQIEFRLNNEKYIIKYVHGLKRQDAQIFPVDSYEFKEPAKGKVFKFQPLIIDKEVNVGRSLMAENGFTPISAINPLFSNLCKTIHRNNIFSITEKNIKFIGQNAENTLECYYKQHDPSVISIPWLEDETALTPLVKNSEIDWSNDLVGIIYLKLNDSMKVSFIPILVIKKEIVPKEEDQVGGKKRTRTSKRHQPCVSGKITIDGKKRNLYSGPRGGKYIKKQGKLIRITTG